MLAKHIWAWCAGVILAFGTLVGPAEARTLTVCPSERSGCRFVGGEGIQAAIDAARSGDTVRLRKGIYYPYRFRDVAFQDLMIRGFIVVEGKRIDIVGEPGAVLDGARGYPTCAILLNKADVNIRGVAMKGFRAALTEDKVYDGHGVFVIDSTARLEDVAISTFRKMGLSIRGASTVRARDTRIFDGHVGVWIEETGHLSLRDVVIENNDSAAIAAYGISNVTVADAVLARNKDDGVYAEDTATIDVVDTKLIGNAPFAARAVGKGYISVRRSHLDANERNVNDGPDAGTVQLEQSTADGPGANDGSRGEGPQYDVVRRYVGTDGGYDYASVDPELRRLYVAREYGVMAVDLARGTAIPKLVAGNDVSAVLILPGGKDMLSTNWGGANATLFDRRSGEVKATIATGQGPDGALYDSASRLAFVMNTKSHDVTLIDVGRRAAVGTIALSGQPEAGASDGDGRVFINIEDKAEIAVVDATRRVVTGAHALPGCAEPTGLAYDPLSHLLIAACRNGVLKLIDARSGADKATVAIGKGADGVLFDSRTRRVFVPCRDGTLTVIALALNGTAKVVDVAQTQRGARTIAIDSKNERLFLPAAQYRSDDKGEEKQVPGSFGVLVVEAQ
jgi:DNA-binding beta-propeller fold protein YncE